MIKTYVRLGLGVGIVANMAFDPKTDTDLCALDAGHLFPASTTKIGIQRHAFLRGYMYEFMELFAPHLSMDKVQQAMACQSQEEVDALFADIELPRY